MRTAFINALIEQARLNPRLFLVVGDLGFSVVEPFAAEFPDRYLNAGVAEQNMTGLAAGLASEGYHVFTYSIANFPTFRCAEQIRNDIAYHQLPVTVVSVGGGVAYGTAGYSHHAVQDLALLRTFPEMTIGAPGDPAETTTAVSWLSANPGPSYLRLGKAGERRVHPGSVTCAPGRPLFAAPNSADAPNLVLTTGGALAVATDAVSRATEAPWALASLPIWGESQKPAVRAALAGYERILTVEDHLLAGGFGSYIREALADAAPQISSVGLDSKILREVASQATLHAHGGLSYEAICKKLRAKS